MPRSWPRPAPAAIIFLAGVVSLPSVLLLAVSARAEEGESLGERLEKIAEFRKKLADATRLTRSEKGLEVTVRVMPDAYLHSIVEDMAEIARAGYDDDRIWAELRKLPGKHRKLKNKVLFLIDMKTSGPGVYFIQRRPKPLELTQKSSKTFRVIEEQPRVKFERWQVFQYPPNRRRLENRVLLGRFKKVSWKAVSTSLRLDRKDPFHLTVQYLLTQSGSRSFKNGINVTERQISCPTWKSLLIPSMKFEFFPGKWEIPEVPEALQFVLARIGA